MTYGSRKNPDGGHLRPILDIPLIQSPGTSSTVPREVDRIYQAKVSFAVTGIDDRSWVAYAFVDTTRRWDTVEYYHDEAEELGIPADPLACGRIPVEAKYLPLPKQYFSRVFFCRMERIKYEWKQIVHRVQSDVKRYVPCPSVHPGGLVNHLINTLSAIPDRIAVLIYSRELSAQRLTASKL